MPDIKGRYWRDVEPLLRDLGWAGQLVKLPNAVNSDSPSNTVVAQDPGPGSVVSGTAQLTVQFAG